MNQVKDVQELLDEIGVLLDNNANIIPKNYLRRLGGKLTILYLRLSREDRVQGKEQGGMKEESNSIINQKIYLTNYCKNKN